MKHPFILRNSIRLDRLFKKYRDNPALITPGSSPSFVAVKDKLHSVVANLTDAGVRKGDMVALYGTNSQSHLYLFLAAWIMDFLYIPLDFKSPLASHLSGTQIDFLVTDTPAQSNEKYVVIHPDFALASHLHPDRKTQWPAVPFRQEASAIFTSGSTGKPNGIVHTVGNYVYSALGTNEFVGLDSDDRWLLSLPLFHVGGALIWVRTLLSGSTCILPAAEQKLEAAIREHRPTIVSLVPTQLMRLLQNKEIISFLQAMKTILLGGAPSPTWLIEKALDLSLPIMPTYGCTESCAQVTGVIPESSRQAYHTAGQVLPYRDVRIADDGVIMLGGKTIFQRYLRDPHSRPYDQEGFFTTADSGTIDEEKNLLIHGRTDGLFISGGENIAPQEIENCLLSLDGVISAIVVPVPHREFGMTPWAFIETATSFAEKSILNKLRHALPSYKLPKRIIRLTAEDRQGKMKYSREALTKLARSIAEGKSADRRETNLHYEVSGPPAAPVIVFLHGFMGKARTFRIIMESLAESFRCIAFDLPGHGSSLFGDNDRLKQLHDMADTARLILEDLDKLGISRCTLYGYSMGGRIAQHIAIASPERIDRLILESASFGIADAGERTARWQRDQALLANIKTQDDFRCFLEEWYKLPLFQTLSGTVHLHSLIADKIGHPVAEYQQALNILSVGGHDFLAEKLAASLVPVYYLCGEKDESYTQMARQISHLLSDMTVKIFRNASHNITIQYPQEIIRTIRESMI